MRVSENGRYLVNDDGTPFFYLVKGEAVDARWFNPVNGEYQFIQRFRDRSVTEFYWSENSNEQDHLLVLSTI